MRAIFVHIHFFASAHQSITLTPAGMTNASHIINAFFTPLYSGIAMMIQASPMIMRAVAVNSVTRSFHMPFIDSFISASDIFLSPWWMRIQRRPQIGPNQTAPNIHDPTVMTTTASQLISDIERKWGYKTLVVYLFHTFYKNFYLTNKVLIYNGFFILIEALYHTYPKYEPYLKLSDLVL